jgi:hypothetical protein
MAEHSSSRVIGRTGICPAVTIGASGEDLLELVDAQDQAIGGKAVARRGGDDPRQPRRVRRQGRGDGSRTLAGPGGQPAGERAAGALPASSPAAASTASSRP